MKKVNNYDNTIRFMQRNIFKNTDVKKTYDKHNLEVSIIIVLFVLFYFEIYRILMLPKLSEVDVDQDQILTSTRSLTRRELVFLNLSHQEMSWRKILLDTFLQIEKGRAVNLITKMLRRIV